MAMMRKIMNRVNPNKQVSFSLRSFSTATTETAKPVTKPKTEKSVLFHKVKAKNSNSSITEILDEYHKEGKSVKRFEVVSLSNYFRKRRNYQSALQLYAWAESKNLGTSNTDQAIRIDLLGKTEGSASAEKYFNSLQDSEKTNKTYGALLNCFCKEKVLNKALEIFEKMKKLNYASVLEYNNVQSLYDRIGQPETVISLVQEMEEKNVAPNGYTHNLLINSYAALKDLSAAEEVLEKMKSNNLNDDQLLFTYGNLAQICAKFGLHEKAKTYLEMMEKLDNQPYKEVSEACRTRIRLYSEMNDLSGVDRAWESLKSAAKIQSEKQDGNLTISNTSYLLMFLACSKLGELEKLERLYKEWEETVYENYDFRLPNVLLEFYVNQDMIEKATALFKGLVNNGHKPNLRSLDIFTALCIKNSDIDLALKYLEMGLGKAGVRKRDWFPTDETIKLFVNYFKEKGDVDRIERFVQSMKKVNRLDSAVYEVLLSNTKASPVES